MKNFLLLVLFLFALAGNSQTDTIRRKNLNDSIQNNENDSLLKMLRTDSSALQAPDTIKPPVTISDTTKSTITDTLKPTTGKIDSLQVKPAESDTTKKITETILVIPQDTVKPTPRVVIKDSLRYKAIRVSNDSIKFRLLDSLTNEELLEYYLSEPEPLSSPKGDLTGDSLYNILNPLTIPTKTVVGESLRRDIVEEEFFEATDSTVIQPENRPKIGIGVGRMAFHGDLYSGRFQSVLMGKPAFDIAISQRLARYLQLDFNFLFGKLGANEHLNTRNENIQSEIRSGGVNLLYDFGNFIPDFYRVRPFFSFGVYGFEFLTKTDLKDKDGKTYFYWSDGSIKDKAEGSAGAQNANLLQRDFTYESDVREQNRDGFGKYREAGWAFPVGLGIVMKLNDRIDVKMKYQYFISTTDYIDGITEKSIGARKGNKRNDNFSYASISVQYDLTVKKSKKRAKLNDTINYNDAYLMALFNKDGDNDSIIDINDACLDTPDSVRVDARGCPLDGDNDGVPDYRDDELTTAAGLGVTARGVGQSDIYWQTWYDNYMNDTLPGDKTTEYTGNIYAINKKKEVKKDPYTVELVRYNGSIPSDELAFLLSIGDINSTTLEDGTTVVYTSGNYEKLGAAIKRRDEFREEGNKKAGVSMFKGRDVIQLPEDELESLLKNEIEDLLKLSVGDSSSGSGLPKTAPGEIEGADTTFNRNEIVYRVQLGAFRNKISTSVFGANTGVLELKTGENVYRYVTKGYPSIEEAASVRADLVVQGYSDAFVTAYRGGRRIPMSETKATVVKNYTEDLNENKTFNSIDKSLLSFKVQLGPLKKKAQEASMDEKVKILGDAQKQTTSSGSIRYTSGNFPGLELAEEYRKSIEDKGFTDAFIIATFKGEIISMQEAMELLK